MVSAGSGMSGAELAQRSLPLLSNCWTLPCLWSHSRCAAEPEQGTSSMWLRNRVLTETHAFSRDWKRL